MTCPLFIFKPFTLCTHTLVFYIHCWWTGVHTAPLYWKVHLLPSSSPPPPHDMIDFHVCSTQYTKTGISLAIIRDSPPRRDKIPSLLPMILCCSCCCSPTSFSIKSILLTTLPLFWSGSLFLVSFISTSSKHPPDSLSYSFHLHTFFFESNSGLSSFSLLPPTPFSLYLLYLLYLFYIFCTFSLSFSKWSYHPAPPPPPFHPCEHTPKHFVHSHTHTPLPSLLWILPIQAYHHCSLHKLHWNCRPFSGLRVRTGVGACKTSRSTTGDATSPPVPLELPLALVFTIIILPYYITTFYYDHFCFWIVFSFYLLLL